MYEYIYVYEYVDARTVTLKKTVARERKMERE